MARDSTLVNHLRVLSSTALEMNLILVYREKILVSDWLDLYNKFVEHNCC